jgi:ADP-ribose pyrophosphatase YjhB (NUDIX family)
MRQAAAREVREECSIEVEVGDVVGILDNIIHDEQGRTHYHYAIVDFAARYTHGTLHASDELMGADWVTPAEFDAYGVPTKAREILLSALKLYGHEQND